LLVIYQGKIAEKKPGFPPGESLTTLHVDGPPVFCLRRVILGANSFGFAAEWSFTSIKYLIFVRYDADFPTVS
jgi:hypothetical protein